MRKSILLAAAIVPLLGLAGFAALALPAVADSEGRSAACAPAADPGPLNLDAIPPRPVTGKLSVAGVGDDDEDCRPAIGGRDHGHESGEDD